jgi:hypothetical protein
MESSRPDALFNDPLAAGLAGKRGLRIARTLWGVGRCHPNRPDRRVHRLRDFVRDRHGHQPRSRNGHPPVPDGSLRVPPLGRGRPSEPHRKQECSAEHRASGRVRSNGSVWTWPTTSPAGNSSTGSGPPQRERWSSRKGARCPQRGRGRWPGRRSTCSARLRVVGDRRLLGAALAAYRKHQPHPNVPVRFDPPSWETFFTQHGWRTKEIRVLGRSPNAPPTGPSLAARQGHASFHVSTASGTWAGIGRIR